MRIGSTIIILMGISWMSGWAWDGQYQVVQQQPIQKFPKWTGILASVQQELAKKADINAPFAGGWDQFVQKNRSGDKMEMIKKVNETFNSMRYVTDQKNWGVPDLWNTPVQFTQNPDYMVPGRVSGDCEDHAISKYYALQKLGFSQDELRILVVKDLNLGVGHCILGVIYSGQCYIFGQSNQERVDSGQDSALQTDLRHQ